MQKMIGDTRSIHPKTRLQVIVPRLTGEGVLLLLLLSLTNGYLAAYTSVDIHKFIVRLLTAALKHKADKDRTSSRDMKEMSEMYQLIVKRIRLSVCLCPSHDETMAMMTCTLQENTRSIVKHKCHRCHPSYQKRPVGKKLVTGNLNLNLTLAQDSHQQKN